MAARAYRLRDVRYAYAPEESPVLGPLSLDLVPGTFVGVLGPNGAGKTTLLRLLAGTLEPRDGGKLHLGDGPLRELSRGAVARRVAIVPARSQVAFSFSALEVVLMGRAPHQGFLAVDSHADVTIALEAMKRAGANGLENRPIDALSSGERQRIIIARALAQTPEIFLLDEPTAHLDLRHQASIYGLFRGEAKRGATVVAALHDPNLAALYCDRILLLVRGQLLADGTPEEVLREERLREAYGAGIVVTRHPTADVPAVLPGRADESDLCPP